MYSFKKFSNIKKLSIASYLSGCLPISIVSVINVNYEKFICKDGKIIFTDFIINLVPILFFITTIVASWLVIKDLKKRKSDSQSECEIENVKRKNLFATGAMSYYVLPFIAFASIKDWSSLISMIVLLITFGWIFVNNRMFPYSPIIDIAGYTVFECDLILDSGSKKVKNVNIITKDASIIYLSSTNYGRVEKVDEDIYIAVITNE